MCVIVSVAASIKKSMEGNQQTNTVTREMRLPFRAVGFYGMVLAYFQAHIRHYMGSKVIKRELNA